MSTRTLPLLKSALAGLPQHTRIALAALQSAALALAPPFARLALAIPFLKSGLTKWSGWWHVSPVADFLFESMFRLHVLGHRYAFPAPDALAHIDAVAEILFPVLLIAGLATRFSALVLLVMTGVIQLTDPTGWANFHLPWAALALAILALGPGKASLDFALERMLEGAPSAVSSARILRRCTNESDMERGGTRLE